MPRRKTPDDYRGLAARRGFEWLGPEVSNGKTKTIWQCRKGHEWTTPYGNIQSGHGCPYCAGNVPKTQDEYRALAREHGLIWLGPVGSKTTWQCKRGHRWMSRYADVQQGYGCLRCAGKAPKTLDDYHDLAKERNFAWLGPKVANSHTKTTWQCKEGHQWEAEYVYIQFGRGCPYCAGNVPKIPDDYHDLAKERNFAWLGPKVANANTKTIWQCKEGHQWEARYCDIKHLGNGCPFCYGNVPKTPDDYHDLGKKRGFAWLGPEVSNGKTKTIWQCKEGHQWEAQYNNIQQGNSCPYCRLYKGEERIVQLLTGWGISYQRQKRFDACYDKRPLPFDFYFQIDKSLYLVEYHGVQHNEPIEAWGGEEHFAGVRRRDAIKAEFAKRHGFVFIVIPHYKFDSIETILHEEIKGHTGKSPGGIPLPSRGDMSHLSKFDPAQYVQSSF